MRLTRATNYALRALVELARRGCATNADLRSLARELNAPGAFLGKVLQTLAHAGLVEGCRGVKGGYRLARPPEKIDVRDVVESMEGKIELAECQSSGSTCSRRRGCEVGMFWRRLQDRIHQELESETVASLAAGNGHSVGSER
jgi:Rrf2 family protein